METLNIIIGPLILTTLAGLSTVFGGFLTFFVKKNNLKALSVGLAFSAGVMIFLSLYELLPQSQGFLSFHFAENSQMFSFIAFFLGVFLAFIIDFFLPDHIEGDVLSHVDKCPDKNIHRIKRAGILTAIAITVHNFPEGIATFFVSTQNFSLGIPIALAIAIHNIPEGVAVSLPIYHATGKKRLAIFYSFLSGISEPIGALLGFMLLNRFLSQPLIGILFACVAGIMVYISLDTLLPLAREYGEDHHVLIGILSGMFFISFGLLLV